MDKITQTWTGLTVAIIASGPSLKAQDVAKLKGVCRVIAINDNFKLCPWADILYAADKQWWEHHSFVKSFAGERWTQSLGQRDWPQSAKSNGLRVAKCIREDTRFSFAANTLHTGRHSGFQAINLAILKGAERVLLLGFDYAIIHGQKHWFGDHPGALNKISPYGLFSASLTSASIDLADKGVEIINCSTSSALTCFRKASLADILC